MKPADRHSPASMPHDRINSRLPADPREVLKARAAAGGNSLAALSRMLRRPDRYLATFVREGHPTALRPDEHRLLADFFGVSERAMGIRDLWKDR